MEGISTFALRSGFVSELPEIHLRKLHELIMRSVVIHHPNITLAVSPNIPIILRDLLPIASARESAEQRTMWRIMEAAEG